MNKYIVATLIFLGGCSWLQPEPRIITQTKIKTPSIVHPKMPNQLNLRNVEWRVFNKEKLRELLNSADEENENLAFLAVTPRGYENLSLNIQELKRYVQQQQEIILFYRRTYDNFQTSQNEKE